MVKLITARTSCTSYVIWRQFVKKTAFSFISKTSTYGIFHFFGICLLVRVKEFTLEMGAPIGLGFYFTSVMVIILPIVFMGMTFYLAP